jgi:hypothetical protein
MGFLKRFRKISIIKGIKFAGVPKVILGCMSTFKSMWLMWIMNEFLMLGKDRSLVRKKLMRILRRI